MIQGICSASRTPTLSELLAYEVEICRSILSQSTENHLSEQLDIGFKHPLARHPIAGKLE